ncbi:MAG: ATP-dependent DNA helicase RecQ [Flavobacteriaceae bacterium]|nr:ATP-dependent DNA helicase RecQ [Flavobacteriaceae bacterium]
MSTPLEILQKYWNFSTFREPQEAIIKSVIENKNTIALLPTGGGKSLCYQIPTLLADGICIVISPLIALMQDQINNLENKGIKAVLLSSQLSTNEINIIFDNLHFGNYKFLYLSPEKLQSEFIQEKIKHLPVSLVAIDEAHCISEWGHDFRPSYLKISILKELHPQVPFIALTATATHLVLKDIIQYLGFDNPQVFKKSFYRKNLAYQIYHLEDKLTKLKQILQKINAPAIIYVQNRKMTKELSLQLKNFGFKTNFYHGGLTVEEKQKSLNQWVKEETSIMVATNAFGMGIDKPNVRAVIHLNIPSSIENYIQEAGRGGRDGKKSFSVVLVDEGDYYQGEQQLLRTLPTVSFIKEVYFKLNQYLKIPYGDWIQDWLSLDLDEFCTHYNFHKNNVFYALKMLENVKIINLDENFNRKSTVTFLANNHEIFNYVDKNEELGKILQLLLRTYGGIIDFPSTINETSLAKKLEISVDLLKNQLVKLTEDEMINYVPSNIHLQLTFLVPREDERTVNLKSTRISQRNDLKQQKFNEIVRFLKNDTTCRNIQLLHYFGEEKPTKCTICDVCLDEKVSKNKNSTKEIENQLIKILNEQPKSIHELNDFIDIDRKTLLDILHLMIERNIINLNLQNKFQLK